MQNIVSFIAVDVVCSRVTAIVSVSTIVVLLWANLRPRIDVTLAVNEPSDSLLFSIAQ